MTAPRTCSIVAGLFLLATSSAYAQSEGDCRKIGGQAAIATGGHRSLAGWNRCPKPEPSVPL